MRVRVCVHIAMQAAPACHNPEHVHIRVGTSGYDHCHFFALEGSEVWVCGFNPKPLLPLFAVPCAHSTWAVCYRILLSVAFALHYAWGCMFEAPALSAAPI